MQALGPSAPDKPAKAFSAALAALPSKLSKAAAGRIRAAAEMGDVTRIKTIAGELKTGSDVFAPISNRFVQLAEDFDFDEILKLAAELDQ